MGDAGMTKDLLRELARAKAVFQQRAILAAMGQLPKPADASPGARPMHPDWARSLRDQCVAAGVAYFFKQWGSWVNNSQDIADEWDWGDADERNILHHWEDGTCSMPLPKSRAGRLLDGRTWDQMPGDAP